jgi:hypothetical protein
MKATEFLKELKIVAEDKTDLIIGFSDGSKQSLIELLDNYARIQIEKDRERVKKQIIADKWEIQAIKDLPITLD